MISKGPRLYCFKQLMGFGQTHTHALSLTSKTLFAADSDHERVFEKVANESAVIQGPPGTGKSQVLTNLVGKFLGAELKTVVVSEKRSALEIIQKKLAFHGLDKLCFIASSDRLSTSFLKELKESWDYFESYESKPTVNLMLSEQLEDQLQMTLDLLANQNLIGGVSFHDFQSLSKEYSLKVEYSSRVPDITELLENKDLIASSFPSFCGRCATPS